jgi:hypothetical protein
MRSNSVFVPTHARLRTRRGRRRRRERIAGIPFPTVVADATLDVRAVSINQAGTLVAALAGDAENLFVTLAAVPLQIPAALEAGAGGGAGGKLLHPVAVLGV